MDVAFWFVFFISLELVRSFGYEYFILWMDCVIFVDIAHSCNFVILQLLLPQPVAQQVLWEICTLVSGEDAFVHSHY